MSSSSLPESHPPAPAPAPEAHKHKHDEGLRCPVTGATGADAHAFCPPQPGDSRSPCPALNTMANHGYIARNGKNLAPWDISLGLRACYGLTTPFAAFLSYTTFLMLRQFGRTDLFEIGRHGVVEHDASLVHRDTDTAAGQTHAPVEVDEELLERLVEDARTEVEVEVGVEGGKKRTERRTLLSAYDVARARVRREKESPPLSSVQAEIARGEMAIILGVWETKGKGVRTAAADGSSKDSSAAESTDTEKAGVRVDWIRRWMGEERLPEGWCPQKAIGMFDTVSRGKAIAAAMAEIRREEKDK